MILKNLIILKKLVKSDYKEKFYYIKHHEKYFFLLVLNILNKK